MQWILSGLAVVAYGIGCRESYHRYTNRTLKVSNLTRILVGCALILHGYLLYLWIDGGTGQDLTFSNIISMCLWISSVLVVLGSWHRIIANFALLVFPLSAVSILLCLLLPGSHILLTGAHPSQLAHILFALLTDSVLALAAMQALLIMAQEFGLRKKLSFNWWGKLPPLQTMEQSLFRFLWLGFIGLSGLLVSSFLTLDPWSTAQQQLKTILALLSWLILATLLIGHYRQGWRGILAAQYALTGILVVFVTSFLLTLPL